METIKKKGEREKKIIFLGSSVTYGASAKGVSFADYIGKRNQAEVVKEAVSGTTLVDNGANSYISRLKKIKEAQADLFICQLSTNDASQKKELGMIGESKELDSFDTETVSGAIEYIICYAMQRKHGIARLCSIRIPDMTVQNMKKWSNCYCRFRKNGGLE